jgi:hypothetical protein
MTFSDLWREIEAFYKRLAAWEDQADAQRVRAAISAFYFNAAPERAGIPQAYATELQIVFNALADMHGQGEPHWLRGHAGLGLALSDTLMYQRDEPAPSDPDLSSFYGLALPLVKNGAALQLAQLERLAEPGALDGLRVLLLTYEGQKPRSPEAHEALAAWVRRGNALIVFGEGDAYDRVREWWNQDGLSYARPQDHLTELLGLGTSPAAGQHAAGKGVVLIDPASPAALAHAGDGAARVASRVEAALQALGLPWSSTSVLALRRGPYVSAAGMDEAPSAEAETLPGTWVNLFDANLAIHRDPQILPDTRWLFYDLDRCPDHPWVIAAAGRVEQETYTDRSLSFRVAGMAETVCSLRARLPQEPVAVTAGGNPAHYVWDAPSRTVLVKFANRPGGELVEIRW